MASGGLQSLMRLLRSTAYADADTSADAALLQRFVTHRDDAAFAALVDRHGPMVLGVCRRVLQNRYDAEDAFQAAFVVLACKARSIARPDQLGSWLYRVAFRAALRARAAAAGRHEELVSPADSAAPVSPVGVEIAELRRVLDEEIDRLPEKFRVPVVLCYLEGQTNEDAARRLRCPTGTIASRLATARERLRTRLLRRGVTLTAGALAAALNTDTLAATVPSALAEAASRTAIQGIASQAAIILAKGVIRTMLLTRIRTVVTVLAIIGLTGGGAGFLATQPWTDAHPQEKPAPHAPAAGDNAANRLTKLLQQRRDAAQHGFAFYVKRMQTGQGTADSEFCAAALRLHESEMALCHTRTERIAACEAHLKRMRDMDQIVRTLSEAGQIHQAAAALGTYYRIDAEIRLEQAKAK
jgi:RNA polymerase sigma factor (sigma-70 family)